MRERHGGDLNRFVDDSGISKANLHRILKGGKVTSNVQNTLCRKLGYSFDVCDPNSDPTLSLKQLEAEFFEWLAAGSRKSASTPGPSRIESYDFLNAPSSRLAGRKKELLSIEDQIDRHDQCIIEIHGPSGSGKTELVAIAQRTRAIQLCSCSHRCGSLRRNSASTSARTRRTDF